MSDQPSAPPIPDPAAPEQLPVATPSAEPGIVLPDLGVEVDGDDRLGRMMATSYLEYASYVIRDRAIPDVGDGLKPVQRRILHSMHSIDDGRFHKVANVIGHTMQYHPHGDASIGSALVVLANKEYFIDRQGNFGNIYTGDPASAARYIECRLTPLAREVLFNRETTEFIDSYDGRNQEPVTLPAKVPVLLMMGADGIAVGMSTRVLPHNFGELLAAQIAVLRGEPFQLYPDFLLGGIMDVSEYDDGKGRIKLRARIEEVNEKTLIIREIPATTTTESLTASIEDAVKRGRMKLAGINDYTAEHVEIELKLPRGIYAKEVIPQLYAYTNCEVSVTSNIVVISGNMPVELSVTEVVHGCTEQLVRLLKLELEIKLHKLEERFHGLTLAQLFIENRLYKQIEEKKTYPEVLAEVHAGLTPFRDQLKRDVTDEDVEKLLQLQIKRISRFDINRNREELDRILEDMRETRHHLEHLTDFAIHYLEELIERFAGDHPRRTEVMALEVVNVKAVALRNIKVGHDRVNQFVGTEVRNSNQNDTPLVCTEYDQLLLLRNDGTFRVINIPEKLYIGPVKYLFKHDRTQIFSILYRHRKSKAHYAKRFCVDRFVTDREYKALPDGCIIVGFHTNHGVALRLDLKPSERRQVDHVDVVFNDIAMRSATARGFKVTAYPVKAVIVSDRGLAEAPKPVVEETPEEPCDEPVTESATVADREVQSQAEPPAKAVAEPPVPPQDAVAEEAPPPVAQDPGQAKSPALPPASSGAKPRAKRKRQPKEASPPPQAAQTEPGPEEAPPPASPEAKPRAKRKRQPKEVPPPPQEAQTEPGPEEAPPPASPEAKPRAKRKRKPKEAPPPPSQEAQGEPAPDSQARAEEWESRSNRAGLHGAAAPGPVAPQSENVPEPAAQPEPGGSAEPSPEATEPPSRSSRKLIDEDTPFFLE